MSKKKMNSRRKENINSLIIMLVVILVLVGFGVGVYFTAKDNEKYDESEINGTTARVTKKVELADGELCDFQTKGNVKLANYKGLKVKVEPEESDVISEIVDNSSDEGDSKSKIVENGDMVCVTYKAKKDGQEIEEASSEDDYIWLGRGDYIDGFESGIVGATVGKKKKFKCEFPKDYNDEDLAGQTVDYTVEVSAKCGVKDVEKMSNNKYHTLAEYFSFEHDEQLKDNRENKGDLVWEDYKEKCEIVSIPKNILNDAVESTRTMYENFAKVSGMTLEETLGQFGMDENSIGEVGEETAQDILISKTILAKENYTVTDEEYVECINSALGYEGKDKKTDLEALINEYKELQGLRPKDETLVDIAKKVIGKYAVEKK
ncbi:MAG: FKBP-type peptidyl-prolyl cis-trans isomerase [Eubacterium sp.]|nr:FKBP-type peptidyl-prolyl cis-trans isomerase [Eubacterium sp.]